MTSDFDSDSDSVCILPTGNAMKKMVLLEATVTKLRQMFWFDVQFVDMLDERLTWAKRKYIQPQKEIGHNDPALIVLVQLAEYMTPRRERTVNDRLYRFCKIVPNKENVKNVIACERLIIDTVSQIIDMEDEDNFAGEFHASTV
jgi:hypothetical protein